MSFIEGDVFHDKRRNLTVYEMLPNFICRELGCHLLNGSSSTIREEI
jgi:hypothetical protein